MARTKTPSFITELELTVDPEQERELLARFNAARNLYNACLSESMVRLNLMRDSEIYQYARSIPRGEKQHRKETFAEARRLHRYSEYELHSFGDITAKSSKWIKEKLDSNTIQTIATRAFKASEKVCFAQAKKVRYKVSSRFRSLENKTNKFGLRWKDNKLVWLGLNIEPRIDWTDPVVKHGLEHRVKYCRLLLRFLNGKRRWYVQLINQGVAYQKPKNYVSEGLVGIDLNVSAVAVVANNHAELAPFCLKVSDQQREITALQHKMERSKRRHNPDNYEPDFQAKRGRKLVIKKGKNIKSCRLSWKFTKAYKRNRTKLADLHRKQAAHRKSEQRKLVNDVLRHGNEIRMENVSLKGWQKNWGKAIKCKAPGFFQSELIRKAEIANGSAIKFPTRTTKLSQTCICGKQEKKPLSQRVHSCDCGIKMHRDLMSGFLSRHVKSGELSLLSAQDGYIGLESTLKTAWQRYEQIMTEQVASGESTCTDYPSEVIVSNSVNSRESKTEGYAKSGSPTDRTPASLDLG